MKRISLPRSEYPADLSKVITELAEGTDKHNGLRWDTIRKITDPLGQLLFVAQRDGLNKEFSIETTAAYIYDLDRRKVKNSTKQTYMKGLWRLSLALGWPKCDVVRLQAEIDFYEHRAKSEVPEKERKLMANPIDMIDISTAARHWFLVAQDTKNETRRRSNFQRAAFVAFTSLVPSRVGDVRHFHIDVDIFRTHDKWMLSTTYSKNSSEQFAELHRDLTPYLDALVHLGEPALFPKLISEKSGKPLFSKKDGNMVLRETLWRHFSIATGGHSPHIVRTLTHDFFAGDDDPQGAMIARILCGQTSLSIGKVYEVHAKRARFSRSQKMLAKNQKQAMAGE